MWRLSSILSGKMRLVIWIAVVLGVIVRVVLHAPAPAHAQNPVPATPPRLGTAAERDPWVDGIAGSLVLCESTLPSSSALDAFTRLAAAPAAQAKRLVRGVLLVLAERAEGDQVARELADRWEKLSESQWTVVRLKSSGEIEEATLALLSSADGLWIQGSKAEDMERLLGPEQPLARVCDELRRRGGVVGGGAALVAAGNRAGWIPGFHFQARAGATPAVSVESIALQWSAGTSVVVRGRELEVLGDGRVNINWKTIANASGEEIEVSGERRVADLTAWRREARERVRQPLPTEYPPADVISPVVPRGTLIIIGGARTPAAAFKEFVAAAGGARASIVVLPISMPAPLPAQDGMAEALKRAGVTDVTVLDQRTPVAIDQPEPLAALRRATGIWFGGGRQWRFVDAYEGTVAEREMHAVLARGGVIAGSSAGATIQGDFLVRGHPLGPQHMICEGYPRGLGFLRGVAIDQHFTQRNRQPDLLGFLRRYPQFLGIGLDESTAIIVRGSLAQVVGEHKVHFFDSSQCEGAAARCDSVSAGEAYDLLTRKAIVKSSVVEANATKPSESRASN